MNAQRCPEISALLFEFLDRLEPPASLVGKEKAVENEIGALLSILLKMAPQLEYTSFVRQVLDEVSLIMKTRYYPTVHMVGATCSNILKSQPRFLKVPVSFALDSEKANAKRMQRGESVGESWLYGPQAVLLIENGLVAKETMQAYRSGAYFNRKKVYGVEAADRWETESKARHSAAKRTSHASWIDH